MRYWTKEEIDWLKENYSVPEPAKVTYKKFTDKFGNVHPLSSFYTIVHENNLKKPHRGNKYVHDGITNPNFKENFLKLPRNAYRLNNYVPEGHKITEIEKGKFVVVDMSTYYYLGNHDGYGKGAITETMIDIWAVKKELKKIKESEEL